MAETHVTPSCSAFKNLLVNNDSSTQVLIEAGRLADRLMPRLGEILLTMSPLGYGQIGQRYTTCEWEKTHSYASKWSEVIECSDRCVYSRSMIVLNPSSHKQCDISNSEWII